MKNGRPASLVRQIGVNDPVEQTSIRIRIYKRSWTGLAKTARASSNVYHTIASNMYSLRSIVSRSGFLGTYFFIFMIYLDIVYISVYKKNYIP